MDIKRFKKGSFRLYASIILAITVPVIEALVTKGRFSSPRTIRAVSASGFKSENVTPFPVDATRKPLDILAPLKKVGVTLPFFSPNDDLEVMIINLIENEQKQIVIAIYSFTNKNIADALQRAQERGVSVFLIVDRATIADRNNKVDYLALRGIPVFVYDPVFELGKETNGIMHNKCSLFFKNINGNKLVATGSLNYTKRGPKANQENTIISSDQELTKRYEAYLNRLKSVAVPLKIWREKWPIVYHARS